MFSASFLLAYHRWSALLCAPIGFMLNFLLLLLILRHTPKEMWVHSRVLLQTCILDILMLIILTMGGHAVEFTMAAIQSQSYLVIFQGYFLEFYLKLWGEKDQQNGLQVLMLLSYGTYHLDTHSISAQFLYRYLVLNRQIKIGIGRYLLFLMLPFLVNLALFSTFPLMFTRNENLSSLDKLLKSSDNGLMDSDSEEKPVYLIYERKAEFTSFWALLFVFSQAFFYSIIIFCGVRMVRFVSAHAMGTRLKELNRQLSRSLIILATYPLVMDLSIALFIVIFGLISTANDLVTDVQLLICPLINWFSVFNPVIGIWINKPYREAVRKAICLCKNKIAPAPIPN